MYGMDISNHQNKIELSKGNYDFAIIKATEGIGYMDGSFTKYAKELLSLKKLIGCYHYARPDLHGTSEGMVREANYFWTKVKENNLANKAILVLDWETEPMDRPDLIEAFVKELKEISGITPFIYGSRSKMKKWKDYPVINLHPIWLAIWPNLIRYEVGVDPNLQEPSSPVDWTIWQYSSTGKYPNFNGNVDLDYCKLDKDGWLKAAGYKETEHEEINEDMAWAIQQGLFVGYGDGKFGPKDPVTREQLASVLRRYTRRYID